LSGIVASKIVLPINGGNMTLESKREYTQLMRERYQEATKKERSQILDEYIKVMGYHRKAAIRTLLRVPKGKSRHKGGRPSQYKEVLEPLKAIWEASDRLCSKRLQPFLPEIIPVLKRNGELKIDTSTEGKLMKLSAATIDRLLEPARRIGGRKPLSTTRPGNLLKSAIPIRTFADWKENSPGFLEIDTVAHCGERLEGFYLYTLCGVDVASGWTECTAGMGEMARKSTPGGPSHRSKFAIQSLGNRF
jgi:hypothetical protein